MVHYRDKAIQAFLWLTTLTLTAIYLKLIKARLAPIWIKQTHIHMFLHNFPHKCTCTSKTVLFLSQARWLLKIKGRKLQFFLLKRNALCKIELLWIFYTLYLCKLGLESLRQKEIWGKKCSSPSIFTALKCVSLVQLTEVCFDFCQLGVFNFTWYFHHVSIKD